MLLLLLIRRRCRCAGRFTTSPHVNDRRAQSRFLWSLRFMLTFFRITRRGRDRTDCPSTRKRADFVDRLVHGADPLLNRHSSEFRHGFILFTDQICDSINEVRDRDSEC